MITLTRSRMKEIYKLNNRKTPRIYDKQNVVFYFKDPHKDFCHIPEDSKDMNASNDTDPLCGMH